MRADRMMCWFFCVHIEISCFEFSPLSSNVCQDNATSEFPPPVPSLHKASSGAAFEG